MSDGHIRMEALIPTFLEACPHWCDSCRFRAGHLELTDAAWRAFLSWAENENYCSHEDARRLLVNMLLGECPSETVIQILEEPNP